MSWWRHLTAGIEALARRTETERDERDEIQHFLEEAAAEYEARGWTRREALRKVRLEFGGEMQAQARLRDHGWENLVEALWTDLRYAARRLRGEPVVAGVTVLTLAVGLGAATAIFSAVETILMQPLPYPDAEHVVSVWDVGEDGAPLELTFGTFRELIERSHSFEALAVFKPWQPNLSGTEVPLRLIGQSVSSGYFETLGVRPEIGRDFRPQDDRMGGPREVVLGHSVWRDHFGSDPEIVEKTIQLDERDFVVIGVMPASFENLLSPEAGIWSSLQYDMSQGRAWGHHLRAVGRLRPGLQLSAATREVEEIAATPWSDFPRPQWASLDRGLRVVRLHDEITALVRPALLAILGAAGLLLLIVCVNVTLLLLARGVRRRGELALRRALGAGRKRLIRQLLTESLLLAAIGAVLGLVFAELGIHGLVSLGPSDLPRIHAVSMNSTVFAAGLGLAVLVGFAFGLVPALRATETTSHRDLAYASSRLTGRRGLPQALIVVEVALAVVLLVGSGLLLRSLEGLLGVDMGFEPDRAQTMQVLVSGDRFDNRVTEAFFARSLEAVRSVPGAASAAFTSQLPLSGDYDVYGVRFGSEDGVESGEGGMFRYTVSTGYFESMGIPLLRGRTFDRRDEVGDHRVAIVSESAARTRLGGLDPIGQPLRVGPADLPPYTIVGVVADVRQASLALGDAAAVYVLSGQWHFADDVRSLVVRSAGDEGPQPADLRAAIWSIDSNRPIVRAASLRELVNRSVGERRFTWSLVQGFSVASLFLAAAGLYGVLAASVDQRSREWGIRSAMGASRRANVALVLRQGLALTALGTTCGVVVAVVITRGLVGMLYGVSNLDPATYVGVVALLIAVATLACGIPALRAGRVDPVTALRAE
ncbi:MAG: ABC transporter permease [Thermoanaerobaculia bacterium]|nr:ABC transporter permease [Thermoanaerobaculia bacterium]